MLRYSIWLVVIKANNKPKFCSVSDCCTLYDEDGTLTPASVSGSGLQSSPVTSAVAPAPPATTTPPVGVIMAASNISQSSVTTSVQDVVFTSNPGGFEILQCYHRQCGQDRSLHLLRSCLAGRAR